MLLQQTINTLEKLRLNEMVTALREQEKDRRFHELTFLERLGFLADRELNVQEDRKLTARLKKAKLRQQAEFEDIDTRTPRGLNKSQILELGTCQWIRDYRDLLIIGPTGVGKTWLACALAQKACRDGFSVSYHRLARLLYELSINRGEGRYLKALNALGKVEVLILDDWGLEMLDKEKRQDLMEILEDRHGRKSTLITSQLPTDSWHPFIGDETIADAILDRLINNSTILNLEGDSMRRIKRGRNPERKPQDTTAKGL